MSTKKYLNSKEAAEFFGRSLSWLNKKCMNLAIPFIADGNNYFQECELDSYLAGVIDLSEYFFRQAINRKDLKLLEKTVRIYPQRYQVAHDELERFKNGELKRYIEKGVISIKNNS